MAFQARGRDPLLDSNTQAAVEKRGKELIGIVLILLGLAAAAMIASYTPDDPSWMSATDAPVQNWMGRAGASIAAPLFMIVGWGAWGVAVSLLAWGFRFALHIGSERAMSRAVFAPIAIALAAVYAATLVPGPGWSHAFGLGGLFGDTVLGSILTAMPVGSSLVVKLASLIMGLAILAVGAFVLGFTLPEVRRIGRFLLVGMIMAYAMILNLLGRGAAGAVWAAKGVQTQQAERRARREEDRRQAEEWAAQQVIETDTAAQIPQAAPIAAQTYVPPVPEEVPPHSQPEKPGLLARMPSLIRRAEPVPEEMPSPELIESYGPGVDVEMPGDDRIKAKITSVIKDRVRRHPEVQIESVAPLTKGRGRGPDPLIFRNEPRVAPGEPFKSEPPLTAAHAPAHPPAQAAMPAQTAQTAQPDHHHQPAQSPAQTQAPSAPRVTRPVSAPMAAPVAAPAVAAPAVAAAAATGQEAAAHSARMAVPAAPAAPQPAPQQPAQPETDPWQIDPDYDDDASGFVAPEDDEWAVTEPATPHAPAAQPPLRAAPAQVKKVVQQPIRKPTPMSRRAKAEAQPELGFVEQSQVEYELPPLALLGDPSQIERHVLSDEALEENARMLESVLDDYGVKGEIVSVRPGPVVTMYELEPAPGLKASRVIGLADDIARSMSALSARVSTVPGRSVIGIELPNEKREMVSFREILSGRDYGDGNRALPLALGKNIGGEPVVANLAKMPHLLIAGTTGSGKSVAINTMILSLLYKLSPDDLRLVMIDPKMLELSVYDGIPHLLSPVVTDPKKAVVALKWVVGEMEERYRKMSKMGVRNIDGYNSRVNDALAKGEMFSRTVQTGFDDDTGEPVFETEETQPEKMPFIVVIVDEMADLMMVAGKEIEACIQRLAQMARASGIHLIMATQRPSVDVITGTIKANFPTRISFQVTSKIDSRTILGEQGAEQLLGMGDMLYMAGGSKIVRCHGPFCSDEEVEEIVNHLKAFGPPAYVGGVVSGPDDDKAENIDAVLGLNTGGNTGGEDALYDQAVAIVIKDRKCSTSYIQRKLAIGYNKAARLVEQMEDENVVSSANHVGKREILVPEQ
ncbi:DNA translocase FtsK [Marinovum sp. 2_MG-2023]|uniref:DNA translocase FtsK n=1 Tax=unclassified Marinovum TaxID=2647166 RepID=UPI0026E4637A|nr:MULTISPECIES: DNA translocase FtsK [unclassified Marinovum]MDO6731524.1 DNA translocase FtsK [Marinovum sp. 2_MG-2023]MDO6780884.1 DNA translocase FtsK [Marinovum sp. 1_MG-2023]